MTNSYLKCSFPSPFIGSQVVALDKTGKVFEWNVEEDVFDSFAVKSEQIPKIMVRERKKEGRKCNSFLLRFLRTIRGLI